MNIHELVISTYNNYMNNCWTLFYFDLFLGKLIGSDGIGLGFIQ